MAGGIRLCFYLMVAVATIGAFGCAKPEQPVLESSPQTQAETPPPTAVSDAPIEVPPPQPAEVEAKINTIFKGAVTIDTSHGPAFIAADFNGDKSQDIAVIVKPVESKLVEINDELANWMLGDPLKVALPDPKVFLRKESSAPEKVRVGNGDTLLAVIHGYAPEGWRNSEATQTYLLRNAVGSEMKTSLKQDLIAARKKGLKIPPVLGDVLDEKIGGQTGFVYYNGATYGWFDPKTYKAILSSAKTPH